MESFVSICKRLWQSSATQWTVKTAYYLFILLALLWIHVLGDASSSNFIYNEF
ncbi:teichoic acid D-Ala incorporation-associated protein DltX [Numidum massiliense]|uniref:teichoic acid D-Ala incorporation-associated protein DltX n=1 Tax=Numidum massiliense TaxID=1522315 RepID=UPI0006D53AC9|nr:teichoic acid D-Ala incorporation-associated protein DltX [Numidum massiliense]